MRVQCYRNLNRGGWSLRAAGRVFAHVDSAVLERVTFHVQPAAQRKIAAGAHRSVHAWAAGELIENLPAGELVSVTYRPHERAEFFRRDTGEPIAAARYALFTKEKGMFVIL